MRVGVPFSKYHRTTFSTKLLTWCSLRPVIHTYVSHCTDIPLDRPVAGVRVGMREDGSFIVNPAADEMADSKLDLVLAGTQSAILMIEGYGDFLPEDQMLEVMLACCQYGA